MGFVGIWENLVAIFLKFVLAKTNSEVSLGKIKLLGSISLFQLIFMCKGDYEPLPKNVCQI